MTLVRPKKQSIKYLPNYYYLLIAPSKSINVDLANRTDRFRWKYNILCNFAKYERRLKNTTTVLSIKFENKFGQTRTVLLSFSQI